LEKKDRNPAKRASRDKFLHSSNEGQRGRIYEEWGKESPVRVRSQKEKREAFQRFRKRGPFGDADGLKGTERGSTPHGEKGERGTGDPGREKRDARIKRGENSF